MSYALFSKHYHQHITQSKEIENEFQQELNMVKSTQSLTYYKNFVFRDTDIDKVKKTVQRGQIKFIDQLELEMRNLAHNYNCYFGANQLVTQSKFLKVEKQQ